MDLTKYDSRKWIMAVLILILSWVALVMKVPGVGWAEWYDLAKWIAGLYFAANVGEYAVDKLVGLKLPAPPAQ